jgi:hypothetical protein
MEAKEAKAAKEAEEAIMTPGSLMAPYGPVAFQHHSSHPYP